MTRLRLQLLRVELDNRLSVHLETVGNLSGVGADDELACALCRVELEEARTGAACTLLKTLLDEGLVLALRLFGQGGSVEQRKRKKAP